MSNPNFSSLAPQTKFVPPLSAVETLPRPRLLNQLHSNLLSHRLILVSAPAGSGKTTLVADLNRERPELPTAWLRLDENDSDPARFAALLLAALQYILPGFGANTEAALSALHSANLHHPGQGLLQTLGVLVNELLALDKMPLALVLDDLHTIQEPLIYEGLDYLLEHSPPGFHLVVLTRYDPPLALARLRVRGHLAEFRLPDLRFTLQEAASLFNEHLQLGLDDNALKQLQAHTEGWAAGLRLLSISLARLPAGKARHKFLTRLENNQRFIFDFLAEEVLGAQEPHLRSFLLETSILATLTPDLCRAVTGREDAADLLETLYGRNLFLTAIHGPASEAVYQYHDLFSAFLQGQLKQQGAENWRQLHARAAAAETSPVETIRHLLEAAMWEEAAQAIEETGGETLSQGRLQLLEGWLAALPPDIADSHPLLPYFKGACALQRWDYAAAEQPLQQALARFQAKNDLRGQADTLLLLADLACGGLYDFPRTVSLLQDALALPLLPAQQVQAHITPAAMQIYAGQVDEGVEQALAAMRIAASAGDAVAYNSLGVQLRGTMLFGKQGLDPFERYSQEVARRFADALVPAHLGAASLLSLILFLRGDLEMARQWHQRAVDIQSTLGSLIHINLEINFITHYLHLLRGDRRAFIETWHALLPDYQSEWGLRHWLPAYFYLRALPACLDENWQEAQIYLRRMEGALLPEDMYENRLTHLTLQGILAAGEGRKDEAETLLRQAIMLNNHSRYGYLFCKPHLWLAHLYRQQYRTQEALAVLREMFSRYPPQQYGGFLLIEGVIAAPLLKLAHENGLHPETAQSLLATMAKESRAYAIPLPGSSAHLTPREVEVLRLIAQGNRNRDIAERLVIAERTVKSHVTNIMNKLGVSSRTQAAAKAREMQIV